MGTFAKQNYLRNSGEGWIIDERTGRCIAKVPNKASKKTPNAQEVRQRLDEAQRFGQSQNQGGWDQQQQIHRTEGLGGVGAEGISHARQTVDGLEADDPQAFHQDMGSRGMGQPTSMRTRKSRKRE
jgi:hypothetical protein